MSLTDIERMVKGSRLLRTLALPAVVLRRQARRYPNAVIDRTLDNLQDLLAQDPVLSLRAFRGDFEVGRQSDLLRIMVATGSYEPELAATCVDHLATDRDAIDVGANVGFYTVLFAKELADRSRVLAIEPTPSALVRLRTNTQLNGVETKVLVFGGVASDRGGEARLNTVRGREEYSSLGSMTHPAIAGSTFDVLAVPSDTVDNLVSQHGLDPGFVKIDVEGMEHVVLEGMRDVLQSQRPTILLEVLDPLLRRNGSSSQEVIAFLRSFGYDVRDPLSGDSEIDRWTCGELLCRPVR